jgi:hypothetical protein
VGIDKIGKSFETSTKFGFWDQGCQIFLEKIYQNEGKCTKLPRHYQLAIKYTKLQQNIPNDHKIFQYFPVWPSKIYPNWDFVFENKPSGNPVWDSIRVTR